MKSVSETIAAAVAAKGALARATSEEKNAVLRAMADGLERDASAILAANAEDLAAAADSPLKDRLRLDARRLADMASGVRAVAELPDPVGRLIRDVKRPNGLVIRQYRVPMGVIAIIYESRPNVTSDAAALALKAGSACVLRCGREARRSAAAIVAALARALEASGFPAGAVSLVEDPSREGARELMTAEGRVDLLIPRGGAGLIRACVENATVPCIHTGTGVCHVYVDRAADLEKAVRIVVNAKTSRPSVCNACETVLVHRDVAEAFLPRLRAAMPQVELRLERDFGKEFLDLILSVGTVDSLEAALAHIARHSTGHSECIVTEDSAAAERFTREVDAAAVYVNASTRFTDGGEFGLGCEMGISTQKLHARGPMGLEELCTTKYVVTGSGQIR